MRTELSKETIELIEIAYSGERNEQIRKAIVFALTDPAIISSLKGGDIKDNKIIDMQVVKLVKTFAECTYNEGSSKCNTQWAFTEAQLMSVVQNIISICHIHNQ